MTRPRIFFGFASSGHCLAETTAAAMALCWYEAKRNAVDLVDIGSEISSDIVGNMVGIAERALAGNATHIFMFETDNTFPADALRRLLAHDSPIVGAAYPKRAVNAGLAGCPMDDNLTEWPESGMVAMRLIGFGCLLIRTEVLGKIGKPYFYNYPRGNGRMMIHDEVFCARALDAGFEIWADAALSREVGHIGRREYRLGPDPMVPSFDA